MTEPVTVADIKAALDITRDDQDAYLGDLIAAGRDYVERYTGQILVAREVTDSFDRFIAPLELSGWPIASDAPVSIGYLDAAGASQNIATYLLRAGQRPARLWPSVGLSWPSAGPIGDAVTVTYTAGYATPEDVPQALRHAIIVYVRLAYDNGFLAEADELAVQCLARPYRLVGIG